MISEFTTRLLDPVLMSNIPFHRLVDRFLRTGLARKKLNAVGEIVDRTLRDISIFGSVTENDRIAGRFKGRDPFYFTTRCKLSFSGNILPQTTEADTMAAYANRIKVLLFKQSVPSGKQGRRLSDKLWDERNPIMTLTLYAYQELIKCNSYFTLSPGPKPFMESPALRGNILEEFLEGYYVCEPRVWIFNTELYAAFAAFCKRSGVDCISRRRFYGLLSGIPYIAAKRLRIRAESCQGTRGYSPKRV